MQRARQIRRVLLVTLGLNLLVSALKIAYGYLTDSVSIISDGYHSAFDSLSNVVGLVAIKLSSQPPDRSHPYGHRKVETLVTVFLGLMMLLACFEIFKNAYEALFKGQRPELTLHSLFIMGFTLIVNLFVTLYEKKMANRLQSEFLLADSRHTLCDVYVTLGVIVGIVAYLGGFKLADAIVGIVVGLFVAYTGLVTIRDASEVLIDKNQSDTLVIQEIVCRHEGVIECHEIRTRGARGHVFLDLHIIVDAEMKVFEAHRIAHEVEDAIKAVRPEIKDVVVHIEPKGDRHND